MATASSMNDDMAVDAGAGSVPAISDPFTRWRRPFLGAFRDRITFITL
jgi:hypothetical protein